MRGESLQCASTELIRVIHENLRRVWGGYPVPIGASLDTWEYKSYGESLYGDNFIAFDVTSWCDTVCVDSEELLFERPILRADFSSFKKSNSYEYVDYIKWERLSRSQA